jgi:LemA protein
MALSKGCLFGLVIFAIIAFVVLLVGGYFMVSYNSLVKMDEEINAQQEEIENQLQRRFDLIPNLVQTVKGYAIHEQSILDNLAEARKSYGGAGSLQDKLKAGDELKGLFNRLMVIVENYPDLKANEGFLKFQDQLEGTENRIAVARGRYIKAVKEFNSSIRKFPKNMIAKMFNFEPHEYIDVSEEAKQVPKVNFGN